MHAAFPALSRAQAERLVEGLDGISQTLIHHFIQRAADAPPQPPSLTDLAQGSGMRPGRDASLDRRFVHGDEPLPDLETAEYVRQALRQDLFTTTKLLLDEMGRVALGLAAGASRKTLAHKRRFLVWHISGGNLAARDLSKRVAAVLESDARIREALGFRSVEGDAVSRKRLKAERGRTIRNLLSEMREAERADTKPYILNAADEAELRGMMETISALKK